MKAFSINDAVSYVENNIGVFHKKRLLSLENLKLSQILKRKNPYLFKAKNILTAQDLVKTILDAHLSSQEETIFGDFLEGLAIFICGKVYDGKKPETRICICRSSNLWGIVQSIKTMSFLKRIPY